MSALVCVFGIPRQWRRIVPTAASISILGLGFGLVATPAIGVPQDETGASGSDVASTPDDAVLTAPDAVSAVAIARLENRPVEVLGERTETGSVFALPDGSMASGQGPGPVWVRLGGDGTAEQDWAAVDLTLEFGDDGLVRPVAQTAGLVLLGGNADVMPDGDTTAVPSPAPTDTPTVAPAPSPTLDPDPAPSEKVPQDPVPDPGLTPDETLPEPGPGVASDPPTEAPPTEMGDTAKEPK